MAITNYALKYLDVLGNFRFNLDRIESLQYGRLKNDEGIAVVVIPGNVYDSKLFENDGRLEIYKFNEETGKQELQGQTCWFLRTIQIDIEDGGLEIITLTFLDTISIIKRRIVAWLGKDIANYPSIYLERFDDIIKLLWYYNAGEGTIDPTAANTNFPSFIPASPFNSSPGISFWQTQVYDGSLLNRQFPVLMEQPDSLSIASPTQIKSDFENLLTAMQDVAENASLFNENIWFDIIYIPAEGIQPATFTFKTFVGTRGTDRSQGAGRVIVGPEYGNLVDATIIKDWSEESTITYAGGNGDNELRVINSATEGRSKTNPFYPIETFINASNSNNTSSLLSDAQVGLVQNRPVTSLQGRLISRQPTVFNKDIFYGDLVYAEFKDFSAIVEITEYEVTVDSSGEEIIIPFGA